MTMKLFRDFHLLLFVLLFAFGVSVMALGIDFEELESNINKNRKDITLANGLSVVLLRIEGAQSVNILLGVKAGSLYEDKVGLANLTSESLLFKNKKYGFMEIPKSIESVGGVIDTSCDYDYSTISIKVLSSDIFDALSKLKDIIDNFYVDDEVLNIIKPNIISSLKSKEDDPWEVGKKAFWKVLYVDHPYCRDVQGDESIVSLTKDNVMRFFNDFYKPDNSFLIVVGGFDLGKVEDFIKKEFSKWSGKSKKVSLPEVKELNPTSKVIVKKDLKQATIRVGHLSTNIKDKNGYALKVLNFIIAGGGFGSRLMDKIREKEGLAYGVFSNFFIDRLMNGYFFVGTQTENKNVDKVISIITNELRDIVQNGVSEKELENAKSFAKGSLPLSMESFSSLSSYLLTEKLYGLERNYFIKSIKEISVIKIDDLKRVAKEYINLDKLSFVVVKGE